MTAPTSVPEETQIREGIREALAGPLGDALASVTDDAELNQALGERYDSLTAMECITAVENRFNIEVDFVADDVRHWFSTIDRMTQFVRERLEDGAVLQGGGR
ncbi:acyl carrier protein [Streptomyces sp. 7-21]|jgi:acyl carrier protein|uniref:acyl carrier protein n=1 Tax=Streptomyces sp. 7-21 TaxID=2802283 RepID=UPI00191CE7A6|nr:acyl carrier protein [Streptomyces sp. 7-21]MBL1065945.1 acyl carrier protein [Streptomyces sp. 7-21]